MTEERIRAINYNVEEIGKYMKSSKKRFEWVVGLNKKTHTITLDFSFISGKVKVVIDGRVILENEIPVNTSFQYPFTLDGFALNLIQQGQSCELRINNKVFSHLYIQEKTEQQFTKEKGQFTIAPDKEFMNKINNPQKMTLDIGNTKKPRKVKNDDGGDWKAFGGFGAPPGFEPPPGFQPSAVTAEEQKASSNNQGAGIDFFADEQDEAPGSKSPEKKEPPSLIEAMSQQPKPAEVNIQSLYSQTNTQNQFFTQIPATLNFGNSSGFTGQQQFQTSGLQNLNMNPSMQSIQVSQQGNFTTGINPQLAQINISAVNFGTNNQASSGFQTNTFGLNQLYATNLNMPGQGSAISMNPGLTSPSEIKMNTGVSANTGQQSGTDFFAIPQQQQQPKQAHDPFGALESIALQPNFHTTSQPASTASNTQNNNMFFTQVNVTTPVTNNQNQPFDLL